MKLSLYLLLVFSFSCKCQNEDVEKKLTSIAKDKACNNIILNNNSNKSVHLYYYDRYQDLVQLTINSNEKIAINENYPLFLKQSNLFQNFYIVHPCDIINIDVNELGNAIFSIKGDSVRNNELDLSRQMNEKTSINFWQLSEIRGKYFDLDYEKYDSFLVRDYNEKILFIEKFALKNRLSESYIFFVKNYLKTLFLDSETYIGMKSKGKIKKKFSDYLEKAAEDSKAVFSNDSNLIFFSQPLTYLKYKFNYLEKEKSYQDSLYSLSKSSLTGFAKEKALFMIVKEQVLQTHSNDKWFVQDFVQSTSDSLFKVYILDNLKLKSTDEKQSAGEILLDSKGSKLSFNDVLRKNKGNILYFDFWASWCAPCRAEMPSSRKNAQYFSGKGIQFIYLSQDENVVQWKKANSTEGFLNYANSYLLGNPKQSVLLKQLKVTTIPRYVIYDKDGHLLNSNAPGPSDPKLIPLLEKLLADGK